MTTEIMDPESSWQINPECMEVLESYLLYSDVRLVAKELGVPKEKVTYYLNRPESKRFLDKIYFEQGYLNRNRIQDVLDEVMELKLEEIRESEIGSKKDIVDIIALMQKIRESEAKISALENPQPKEPRSPTVQNNTQVNLGAGMGDNYNSLLDKLVNIEK